LEAKNFKLKDEILKGKMYVSVLEDKQGLLLKTP
jgi:hypothetical protein